MVKESTLHPKEQRNLENGKKGKESDGLAEERGNSEFRNNQEYKALEIATFKKAVSLY